MAESSTSRECKRSAAAAAALLDASSSNIAAKRRKLSPCCLEEDEEERSSEYLQSSGRPESKFRNGTALFGDLTTGNIVPPAEFVSGESLSSSCSDLLARENSPSSVSMEKRKEDPEPEVRSFHTETSTCISANFRFSTESTPQPNRLSGSSESSKTMEPSPPASNRRRPRVTKMPPQAEIEEFFSAAEKYEANRFTENYNYDIVKDEPLEGRYQWLRDSTED